MIRVKKKKRTKKAKDKTPCKVCGAFTHKTSRSRLCPFNNKYKTLGQPATPVIVKPVIATAAKRFGGKSPRNPVTIPDRAEADDTSREETHDEAIPADRAEADDASREETEEVGPCTPPPPVPVQEFQPGDNVNAEWVRGSWFLGQVTEFEDGRYTVYFLFGKAKENMMPSKVRASDSRYPRRGDMLGRDFWFDGAQDLPEGRWRVRQLLNKENMYKCTRLSGAGSQNVEDFDIGYVIKQYMQECDNRRESGVGTVLETRTRRAQGNP